MQRKDRNLEKRFQSPNAHISQVMKKKKSRSVSKNEKIEAKERHLHT